MSFLRFGQEIYRRRKVVVGLWLLLVLVSLPLAPRVEHVLQVGGFSSENMESAKALVTLQRNLDFKATSLSVIFSSDQWTVDDPRFLAAAQAAVADVTAVPEVAEV
ncbi:MAG: hypothetical protein ACTHMA_20855, partial [Thermomicrobiales bacterium]